MDSYLSDPAVSCAHAPPHQTKQTHPNGYYFKKVANPETESEETCGTLLTVHLFRSVRRTNSLLAHTHTQSHENGHTTTT